MPTAARLFGALLLASLAFFASVSLQPFLPDGTPLGYMPLINAGIGLLVGWTVIGDDVGLGYWPAVTNGLTGVLTLVFLSILLFGLREMFLNAMHHMYRGPLDALSKLPGLMKKDAFYLLNGTELGILLGGGAAIGLFVEFITRRLR